MHPTKFEQKVTLDQKKIICIWGTVSAKSHGLQRTKQLCYIQSGM